ncbi:hypothetical protein QA861_30530 [Streptomyces sp. B21-083]
MSPEHFARIGRVRTVLAAGAGRWSEIAATAGYYDQSHMTAEFRHLMGVPPRLRALSEFQARHLSCAPAALWPFSPAVPRGFGSRQDQLRGTSARTPDHEAPAGS